MTKCRRKRFTVGKISAIFVVEGNARGGGAVFPLAVLSVEEEPPGSGGGASADMKENEDFCASPLIDNNQSFSLLLPKPRRSRSSDGSLFFVGAFRIHLVWILSVSRSTVSQSSITQPPPVRHASTLSRSYRCVLHLRRTCVVTAASGVDTAREKPEVRVDREPMVPPYNVLITGSTKGIGYALAKEFLKAGDNVIICSRSAERVEETVSSLRNEFGEQHVWGTKCDVRNGQDVKDLVAYAQKNLTYVDIWINNAGSNAYSYKPLSETSDEDLIEVVTTNTLGLMICCREAMKMMINQPRGGHIFNIDGAGSDGRPTPRFAAYGATKRSVVHLTKSLQAELQMHDVKNVIVHNLSPGMVTTDLLMSGANTKQAKFFINVLAEPAEVVAEYLVPNIREIPASGSTRPTYIRFLTGLKADLLLEQGEIMRLDSCNFALRSCSVVTARFCSI
ncbi:unnamed protein product [Rhodiola kirilowii]